MRMSPRENLALGQLAKRAGVSKTQYLRRYIERQAKKAKIPI